MSSRGSNSGFLNRPAERNTVANPGVSRVRKSQEPSHTTSVGRVGKLTLHYVHDGTRTVFGRTNSQTPWHLFPPIYLDDSGAAYTLLLNPSGGLVGGDHLSIDMEVEESAHVLISTPSANRVYRSPELDSFQEIDIRLAFGSRVEWLPEQTIPFAGSRFRQSINVRLAPGASIILWDAIASGRIASGERWAFTSLHNTIRITTASGSSVVETYELTPPTAEPDRSVLAADWDYIASLFIIGDEIADGTWKQLESELGRLLDIPDGRILGGVSRPDVPGLAVKLVARSAPDLSGICDTLWAAARRIIWALPPAVLRKY